MRLDQHVNGLEMKQSIVASRRTRFKRQGCIKSYSIGTFIANVAISRLICFLFMFISGRTHLLVNLCRDVY